MAFSDSHCHLVNDGTQPEHLAEALDQARAKGVEIIISMAMTTMAMCTFVGRPSYLRHAPWIIDFTIWLYSAIKQREDYRYAGY